MAATNPVTTDALQVPRDLAVAAGAAREVRTPADIHAAPLSGAVGSVARALALFGTLGAALVFWMELTFRSRWVTKYLTDNVLPADHRKLLFHVLLAGGLGGALASWVAMAVWVYVRRRPVLEVERFAWFLSPLCLLPFLPVLFRYEAWKKLPLEFLVTTALFALLVEGTVLRSLRACPERLLGLVRRASERMPRVLKVHAATVAVLSGALYYTYFMSRWTIVRNHKLQSAVYDLGISDNLMYNALRGHFMVSPIFSGAGAHPGSFLGAHAQLGAYVLLPFYALRPDADTLLIIQSALLAATALPLYYFARRRVAPWTSALVALAFLAYYPMHGANFHDMTFIPVAAFFVVATIWAVDRGSWLWFWPALFAALSMREDIAIGLAVAGLVFLLAGKRPAMAITLTAVSVVAFIFIRFWLMPHEGTWVFPDMLYSGLIPKGAPKTFSTVAETLATNPSFAFRSMLTQPKFLFFLHLMVPLAFLPLRRGWLWATLVPGILLTLLTTNYAATVDIGMHYTMHWAPYLFLAVPLALVALRDQAGAPKMRAAFAAMLMATAVTTWSFGAFAEHPTFKAGFGPFKFEYTNAEKARHAQVVEIARKIPDGASLAVSEVIGSLVANRVNAYSLRDGVQDADYLLTGQRDLGHGVRAHLQKALSHGKYGVVARIGEFALFKKGASIRGNVALRKDWHI